MGYKKDILLTAKEAEDVVKKIKKRIRKRESKESKIIGLGLLLGALNLHVHVMKERCLEECED